MWTCPLCNQQFIQRAANHSCNEKSLEDFTRGKNPDMLALFDYFIEEYRKMGPFKLHPTRSRVGLAARVRFCHLHRIGLRFVDITFSFSEAFRDNLCFYRIGEVPGGKQYQHYLRLERKEDVNEEVRKYMKMALERGS